MEIFNHPLVAELLNGAIEMHVHTAPDVVPRKCSDIQLLNSAKNLGFQAILIKAHFNPTTARAILAQEAVGGIKCFGGITLNKQLGGLNPSLVDCELKMGAKAVWLPTQSAENDIVFHNRGLEYAKKFAVPLKDDRGRYFDELHEILELVAKYDVIFATGHLAATETEEVVALAKSKKVNKILITHPEAPRIAMPLDMQKRLSAQGAIFEWCCFNMDSLTDGRGKISPEIFAQYMRNVGVQSSIMATDMGQINNFDPPEGMAHYIKTMLDHGFSTTEIKTMVQNNPQQLLGL